MKLLMIGRNRPFMKALEQAMPGAEVYLLEEPDLYAAQQQEKVPFVCSRLMETRLGEYQQSLGLMETVKAWHQEVRFDVVVPGVEYAVSAAGAVAQELGFPYLGPTAVHSLTNKLRLRRRCQEAGILQPRFRKVESLEEVQGFFEGRPIVLKPANRQASAGVIKIRHAEEIAAAYRETLATDEGTLVAKRDLAWEFLAEEYVGGQEYSVETLVQNGRVLFHNITEKRTTEGKYFVELGHVVPAALPVSVHAELLAAQNRLVQALQAGSGVLHAEWKVNEEGPHLIECAGRVAGDFILELIEQAYGFNVYVTLLRLLNGEALDLPQTPKQGACIRFFEPAPGRLVAVRGLETLQSPDNRVVTWAMTAKPGDLLMPLTSSWGRVGHLIVTGRDSQDAMNRADALVNAIQFIVEPAS